MSVWGGGSEVTRVSEMHIWKEGRRVGGGVCVCVWVSGWVWVWVGGSCMRD